MTTTTTRKRRALDGQVALVTGGGKGIGRAVALALSARGVRVVVTGRTERALGEVVGEIANAGGKARHLAGDVGDPAHLDAAIARAVAVFGGLDIVVANAGHPGPTFAAAARAMKGPGRLLSIGRGPEVDPAVRDAARELTARGITANAIFPEARASGPVLEPAELAEVAVFLCTADADRITGQCITMSGATAEGG
jgi:NAD(P)-dependent dehydrogenase (short-subunit alcohol dehydrogenase family)